LRDGTLVRVGHGGGGALGDGAFVAVGLGKGGGRLDTCRTARGHRLGRRRSRCGGAWTGADLCAVRDQDHLVISPRCLPQVTRWDRGRQRAGGEPGRPADYLTASRLRCYGDWSLVALSMVNHRRPSA
jgi:hypothetical protein